MSKSLGVKLRESVLGVVPGVEARSMDACSAARWHRTVTEQGCDHFFPIHVKSHDVVSVGTYDRDWGNHS